MRSNFDFTPYRRSSIGFDRLFDLLEGAHAEPNDGYPPFNIEQSGEDRYQITLAVAGFSREEIDVISKPNLLVVTGRKGGDGDRTYLHRGIATRAFERQFELADYVTVLGASLTDGLLRIDLKRELPEAVKPRKIEIGGPDSRRQLGSSDTQKAA